MKRKRHTPEQIVKKLGAASEELGRGTDIGNVCRKLAISCTFICWTKWITASCLLPMKIANFSILGVCMFLGSCSVSDTKWLSQPNPILKDSNTPSDVKISRAESDVRLLSQLLKSEGTRLNETTKARNEVDLKQSVAGLSEIEEGRKNSVKINGTQLDPAFNEMDQGLLNMIKAFMDQKAKWEAEREKYKALNMDTATIDQTILRIDQDILRLEKSRKKLPRAR
jgi:hypothetical protein